MEFTALQEKYEAEGFKAGVLAERKKTLLLLENIAEARDPESALRTAHSELLALQTKEVSAMAQTKKGNAAPGDDEARAFRGVDAALKVGAANGAADFGDKVADALDRKLGRSKAAP